ncbi:TRAF3-interacting protein 1 isoform X2 [Rhinatrema bivittatum]|uniref:TRAF3-interacting protein 1 isoform X2 n=1 Tax=Rhinatrema bivittatum TaxID=194408 RepID=UPI00112D51A6|nr:TRAF3-interacting protein 1 isoform X2 [Rhinatrema bivittatum]
MDSSVVRRTQESLGKVLRKPPLTDKLLGKPPFRYLHDIISEVIRSTGFMKGLYTETEMKSDNVKDKDAKISFLQKAIDVVVMVTEEPLSVKPARIVAGHEPEKTNELLQAIGKCCLSKLSSDDAVKRVLAGEKTEMKGKPPFKPQDKENRESKMQEKKNSDEKVDRKDSEIRDRSSSRDLKDREQLKEERKTGKEKEKFRESEKDSDKDMLQDGEKLDKEGNRNRSSRPDKERGEKGQEREKKTDGGKVRERKRDREKGREKDKDHERDHERERDLEREKRREHGKDMERSRDKGKEQEKPKELEKAERKFKGAEEISAKKSSESVKDSKAEVDKESHISLKISRPSASKLQRQQPLGIDGRKETKSIAATDSVTEGKSASTLDMQSKKRTSAQTLGGKESHRKADTNVSEEKMEKSTSRPQIEGEIEKPLGSEAGDLSDELASHITQRRIPRPSSARPAPPRVKHQGTAEVPPERVSSGNVIIDKRKDDGTDDDDDQFVVMEAAPQIPEMPEMEMEPSIELDGNEKHGGLVKRILETKKEYETQEQSTKAAEKGKPQLSDATRKKEKDLVSKDIEKLRTSVQTLCRSALPLGKIMNYIQEDMDAMQNELQTWRRENRQHEEALLLEQSITESAVEPLKQELAGLEQQIKEQQDKICTMKANILRNEEKIQKMVFSINVSSKT